MTVTLDLDRLEAAVEHALRTGEHGGLHVLGYGEITSVVAWPTREGPWACKRLPVFDDRARLDAYRSLFGEYLAVLAAAGLEVHETVVHDVATSDGDVAAYCVQPALDKEQLAPVILRGADARAGEQLLGDVFEHIGRVVTPHVGLDGQLSNWARRDGSLLYFDVTTPLLRDDRGRDRLDTELFMASLPAVFRPLVRRFLRDGILDPYYDTRTAGLDVCSNLHKEGLSAWVPAAVSIANERLGIDLTLEVVDRHYRKDARLWSTLQRFRRIDRAWQRHVRRRPYPFLLPGKIDRHR